MTTGVIVCTPMPLTKKSSVKSVNGKTAFVYIRVYYMFMSDTLTLAKRQRWNVNSNGKPNNLLSRCWMLVLVEGGLMYGTRLYMYMY